MAYLIRRLLENTANSSFLRQNLEERPVEELLIVPTLEAEEVPSHSLAFQNVADTDYSTLEERNRAQKAFQIVRQQLGKTYLPLVNGERIETSDRIDSVNPSNPSEVVGQIGLLSVEQAEAAIQAAKAAFPAWRKTPPQTTGSDSAESRRLDGTATGRTFGLDGAGNG